ncbi:MAG: hypothetical protein HQ567_02140 [Candidatus Nealsonbacteria bacterium]|nr:hypothetical protein [Candidatus Nealsonbacteria bacterium]
MGLKFKHILKGLEMAVERGAEGVAAEWLEVLRALEEPDIRQLQKGETLGELRVQALADDVGIDVAVVEDTLAVYANVRTPLTTEELAAEGVRRRRLPDGTYEFTYDDV